jgi:hypothetical protein
MSLNTQPNFNQPGVRQRWPYVAGDAFYETLVAAHRGLTDSQSDLLNARLIVLLANHIGDLGVLREAMAVARSGVVPNEVDSTIDPTP